MLEYLRNASEKPVAKILIGILAFSFVGWGVAEWIFGNVAGDNTLVNIGNTEITAQHFNAEKTRELAQKTREEQRDIYADPASQRAFSEQVLAKIAAEQMTENRAHDLGFVVSDKRIAHEIREFPEFQVNGEFSTFAFDSALNNSGYSEAEFANVLRGQVLRSMVLDTMLAPIPVPEFVARANYDARYGEREIEYTTVKYSDFSVEKPTYEQLSEYYAQNPKIIPEMRTVSYIFIPTDMSAPDKYDEGYATAVKIEDDIIAGEAMDTTAKKHNAKYVSLDAFSRENRPVDKLLTDSMVAKIFDMDSGLESEMIETKDGFLFLRVDNVTPSHTAEFNDVKQSLVSDWEKSEQKKQAYIRANEILVDVNAGKPMSGKTTTVSRTSGAPTDVLVAAFKSGDGTNTIVSGNDAFFVLSVKKSITPKQNDKKMADTHQELKTMSETITKEDYNSFLKREYPVKVNERVYNRFFENQ